LAHIPITNPYIGNDKADAYLHGASSWLMLNVLLGSNLGLGFVFEIKLHGLDLLVTSSGFMGRIFQGADLGLCVPRQLYLLDLKEMPVLVASLQHSVFCCGLCFTYRIDHPALYLNDNYVGLRSTMRHNAEKIISRSIVT
jgi:hypothetical protein